MNYLYILTVSTSKIIRHQTTSASPSQVGCGGAGYTGAGKQWLGPRDWTPEQYGPGATCIATWWIVAGKI